MSYLTRRGVAGLGDVGTPPGGTTWCSSSFHWGWEVICNEFRKKLWDYWSTSGWSIVPEQVTPEQMAGGLIVIGLLKQTGQSMTKPGPSSFDNLIVLLEGSAKTMQPTRMALVSDVVTAGKLVASGWNVLDGDPVVAGQVALYLRKGILTSRKPLTPGQSLETFKINDTDFPGDKVVPWSDINEFSAYRVPADQTPPSPVVASMGSETPKWVVPVAIGAGVLVLGGLVYAATRK